MKRIIGKLEAGGIVVTYFCNARCKHCLQNASPDREFQFISTQKLETILDKLQQFGCKSVHLEGGEPFLFPGQLVEALKTVKAKGFIIEHIVTNGSWYRNESDTFNLLTELKLVGLNRLVIKLGPFQNEFIPLSKIIKLSKVATKAGINTLLLGADLMPELASLNPSKTHSLKEYHKRFGHDFFQKIATGFELPYSGRSLNVFPKYLNPTPLGNILRDAKDCKKELNVKHHFHIDLYGNFIFPYSKGLTIPIAYFEKSATLEKLPFLTTLIQGGIQGLFQLATTQFHFKPNTSYLSKCHLCFHIREHLVNKCHINSPDLQPIELYM